MTGEQPHKVDISSACCFNFSGSTNVPDPISGSAVEQNQYQEVNLPNSPNLMKKPVDKIRVIRYNFYNIFD